MIKKLRIRFIVLSMSAVFLVLVVIIGSINFLNYHKVMKETGEILTILAQNKGTFPRENKEGWKLRERNDMELPYESRYFSVLLKEDGTVESVDTGKIAAVDTATAAEYAVQIWESQKTEGFLENYRYVTQEQEEGQCQVIFLDCTRYLSSARSFLVISCGMSALGYAAVFLLILLSSNRLFKPVLESYEKQKRFITDAGHELKTPITIIDADVEILSMELGENEWLMDIRKQAKRLAGLTGDLIYLSRMEEEIRRETILFPISEIAQEVAQSFETLAKAQNRQFATQIAPALSLQGDEKAIRQLMSILLDNAVKYTPEQGRIVFSLKKQGKYIELSVTNDTQEVKKEDLPHLFDRFYRTDQSRNSQTGGYGIGLSIAKAVTEAHRGKIAATSKDSASLSITAYLPC